MSSFKLFDFSGHLHTTILFQQEDLIGMTNVLELSYDFIMDHFYNGTSTYYLESRLYQRMLDKADTEEKRIRNLYPHLGNSEN